MPLTASKTDTCTMAKTLDETMGEVFAVSSACCAFWFQSVTTSALAEPHRTIAKSAATRLSANFLLKFPIFIVVLLICKRGFREREPCAGCVTVAMPLQLLASRIYVRFAELLSLTQ